jgi:AcrR family transcriptional regulator
MTPRRSSRKQTAAGSETRARIVNATRELAVEEGFRGFTMEKVAERAGVSRMTVYYQFGSKADLLEALFDDLAARGRMDRLADAFVLPDPLQALEAFIAVFCGFWESDRIAIRRLRGWALLDPEFEDKGRGRDAWRRQGLEVVVGRIRSAHGVPAEGEVGAVIDLIHTLTSFEAYDNLARGGRGEHEVAELLQGVARNVIGVAR